MFWQCERYHALPDAGGIYDQPAWLMYQMAALANVYNSVYKLRNAKGKEIHRLTTAESVLLEKLRQEGML